MKDFMQPIHEPRVFVANGKFCAVCQCGAQRAFTAKANALKMLKNGRCQVCRPQHSSHVAGLPEGLFKRDDGKWCCHCSGCGKEQAYTRKDHAKQSLLNDWQCKPCASLAKGFSQNLPVGDRQRVFNRFSKSAKTRKIDWNLTLEEMYQNFNGKCVLTNWPISLSYSEQTASLDRIDSSIGYAVGNIQWVHVMVNMSKNKYTQDEFIRMCKSVANNVTTPQM